MNEDFFCKPLVLPKASNNKKYEFGAKACIAMPKTTAIIVGVQSFLGNPYDGDTLEGILLLNEKRQKAKNREEDENKKIPERASHSQVRRNKKVNAQYHLG